MSILGCSVCSFTLRHSHAPDRERDIYHCECKKNQVAVTFNLSVVIFGNSEVGGRDELFPTKASMCEENDDATDVKVRPGGTLEYRVFQLVDVTYWHRGDRFIVCPPC